MFKDFDLISSYSAEQALEDGTLTSAVISRLAREFGYRIPVIMTAALFQNLQPTEDKVPEGQSLEGRIWDMLNVAASEIARNAPDSFHAFKFSVRREDGTEDLSVFLTLDDRHATFMLPEDY